MGKLLCFLFLASASVVLCVFFLLGIRQHSQIAFLKSSFYLLFNTNSFFFFVQTEQIDEGLVNV